MGFKGKTVEFIQRNKFVLLASFLLLAWKIFLIQVLWDGRLIPPEPDDAYIYVTHIESVRECPSIFFCEKPIYPMTSFGGYSHLSYRLLFGYMAIAFNLSSEQVFHLSFYLGTVLLIPVLWLFLKSLGFQRKLLAFAFLFALLPHGGSGMHSFAWMVPSYYALLLIMLIFSFILGNFKRWYLWIILTVPIAVYTHTITVYLLAIPVLYTIILSLLTKKVQKEVLIKTGFSLAICFLVYLPVSVYLSIGQRAIKGNPYGVENFLKKSLENQAQKAKEVVAKKPNLKAKPKLPPKEQVSNWLPGFQQIKYNYLQLVLFNPLGIVVLFAFTAVLLYYKKFQIISIYFASLIFLLLSSINYFGFRSLLLIWPITFFFYAAGFWYSFDFMKEGKLKPVYSKIVNFGLVASMIGLFSINLLFSYFYHEFDNQDGNFPINKKFSSYLEENLKEGERVVYSTHLLRYVQWIYGDRRVSFTKDVVAAKYYVYVRMDDSKEIYDNSYLNKFINYVYGYLGINREKEETKNSLIPQDGAGISRLERKIIESDFELEREFGRVKIYRNKNIR